jgi:hypothetical protein
MAQSKMAQSKMAQLPPRKALAHFGSFAEFTAIEMRNS